MTDYFADDIIQNKLGITDDIKLQAAEEKIISEKAAILINETWPTEPNMNYFKHIHKILFEDMYDFAGQFRSVDIIRRDGVTPFAYAQFIPNESERIFRELKIKKYLQALDEETFIAEITNLSMDLNALHPFREGNGRTIRLYLILLAYHAGYLLDYSKASSEEIIHADKRAFEGDEKEILTLYKKIVSII